ncbi:MAG TPA: hemerythrin domain-containing protein [bacterium]|nr:hemerythrin domain-containing protein [bacterium]HOL47108.1 hemerythrin domain-containing protein [bacterium]HPQ18862.1 hemerythrin domain-containing protein [bacterium]
MTLIEELKSDHKKLLEKFLEIQKIGIAKKEGKDELYSIKNLLLSHLKKEDVSIYPVLQEKAKNDSSLQIKLNLFTKEMNTINNTIIKFFEKYSLTNELDIEKNLQFIKEITSIITILRERIRKEEEYLYPEYK